MAIIPNTEGSFVIKSKIYVSNGLAKCTIKCVRFSHQIKIDFFLNLPEKREKSLLLKSFVSCSYFLLRSEARITVR